MSSEKDTAVSTVPQNEGRRRARERERGEYLWILCRGRVLGRGRGARRVCVCGEGEWGGSIVGGRGQDAAKTGERDMPQREKKALPKMEENTRPKMEGESNGSPERSKNCQNCPKRMSILFGSDGSRSEGGGEKAIGPCTQQTLPLGGGTAGKTLAFSQATRPSPRALQGGEISTCCSQECIESVCGNFMCR